MPGYPGSAASVPFDGWSPLPGTSEIVDVYPRFWHAAYAVDGRSPDKHDAYADSIPAASFSREVQPSGMEWTSGRASPSPTHRRAISPVSRRKSLHSERVPQPAFCSAAASSSAPLPFVPVRNPSRRPIPPAKSIISDRERVTTLLTSGAFAHNPAHRRLCAPRRSSRMSLRADTGTQLLAG